MDAFQHMPNKRTIIILSPGFAATESDSTCLPAHQVFVKTLNNMYPDLNIIILAFHYPFIKLVYQWFGNEIISFDGRSSTRKLKMLMLWLKVWNKLRRIKRNNEVIGMLSFWCTDCALVGNYFGKIHGVPHFSWITGQDAKKENKFVRFIRPKSNNLVAMSDFLAAEFFKNHRIQPAHVITNGIDINLFRKEETVKTIDIMGAGSLIPLKQYDVFIEVCEALTLHFNNLKIVLCGAGPEENLLLTMIADANLQDEIILTGELAHSEVLDTMQTAKLFLHTSNYEGFSTVCLEALYAGCQVISFIKPMQQDIAHWHIVNTKEQMIEKAISLLEDEATDYSPKLPFTMEESAKKIMQLFGY